MKKKRLLFVLFLFVFMLVVNFLLLTKLEKQQSSDIANKITFGLTPFDIAKNAKPAPTSLPTPKASPKPLTFSELNSLYGPCVYLPVIFYHHIQNMDVAKAAGQQNLTVATTNFITQMQYLKDKGYTTVSTNAITDFFDKGIPVPSRAILLTFDDGYEDFYVNVLPVLRQDGFKAVIALPTGLVGNPGYLTWDEVSQAASSGVEVVNHTWSHASIATANTSLIEKEVMTADGQLTQRGFNQNKAFVYPYGGDNSTAINFLRNHGYSVAFTTVPGSTLCKKQRYTLPRIRIGNASLSAYGI